MYPTFTFYVLNLAQRFYMLQYTQFNLYQYKNPSNFCFSEVFLLERGARN